MVDSTNLPDVDINQIATDLNGKMDRDCLNASDTGNIQMAHNAMPSDTYIDLSITNAGTYTAPADGYYCICGMDEGENNTYQFVLRNQTRYFGTSGYTTNATAAWCNGTIPAKKGDVVYLYTNNINSTTHKFRFYYAVGSESEAS